MVIIFSQLKYKLNVFLTYYFNNIFNISKILQTFHIHSFDLGKFNDFMIYNA